MEEKPHLRSPPPRTQWHPGVPQPRRGVCVRVEGTAAPTPAPGEMSAAITHSQTVPQRPVGKGRRWALGVPSPGEVS